MKRNTNVNGTKHNGGCHSVRHQKAAFEWIDACTQQYSSPRLYHVVFGNTTDAEGWAGYPMHKAVLKDLMQRLRRKGIPCSYRAAKEDDSARNPEGRGQHLHAFICVDARSDTNPDAVINSNGSKDDGWLYPYALKRKVRIHIYPPKNEMHHSEDRTYNYAYLAKTIPAKVENAKEWISYMYKNRDKPSSGEVYTASRNAPTLH